MTDCGTLNTGCSNCLDCRHGTAKLLDGYTVNAILLWAAMGINQEDGSNLVLFKNDENDKEKFSKSC